MNQLRPNHHGLAIVVPPYPLHLAHVLTRELRLAVYKPKNKLSVKSYMQAVDLVELKHHPIVVVVGGYGEGHLIHTDIGSIDIKDIMAPLFPPIATHLADNPKIFLFVVYFGSSERHALHLKEPIWENYIVGYITFRDVDDMLEVTHILEEELASPSMSVQEIFTSISDELPPYSATMSVIDHLKEPVYLHPHGSRLMETHSRLQGIMSIMYSHTSHHASLPTLGSTKELDTESPRLEQLTSDKLQIDEDL